MTAPNVLAVLVSTLVAFGISGAYYAAVGTRLAQLSPAYAEPGGPAAATIALELLRSLVVAVAVAALVVGLGLDALGPALVLGLGLWVSFPVVLLLGSVIHERVPPLLAAIHAGDWLLKLAAVALIVTVWR